MPATKKGNAIMKKKDSPALQLVRLVYIEGQQATGHSWVRLNSALFSAVKVAIKGGLLFDIGDFKAFHSELRAGYWIGAHPHGLYAIACEFGNLSACKSYEQCYGFAPYELEGQRVFVGRQFTWAGEHVTCTSIAGDALVACSYKPNTQGSYERKILHRFSITNEEMKTEDKRRSKASADKKMERSRAEAEQFAKSHHVAPKILAALVSNRLSRLEPYQQERVQDVLKRRFKKADKPTLLDLLAIGHRYPADHHAVAGGVLAMARGADR